MEYLQLGLLAAVLISTTQISKKIDAILKRMGE
jgi:hypothetical protein